eukprot:943290-Rhodomonas_salina.2
MMTPGHRAHPKLQGPFGGPGDPLPPLHVPPPGPLLTRRSWYQGDADPKIVERNVGLLTEIAHRILVKAGGTKKGVPPPSSQPSLLCRV